MERTLDYAYVRDDNVEGVARVAFVRLVPADTVLPATTVSTQEAHVDFDAEGNIIGVTVFLFP